MNFPSNFRKTIAFSFSIALTATLFSFTPIKHEDTFKVNPKLSALEWQAEKLTGKHNGDIQFSVGEIKNNHGAFTGFVEVDMTSIKDKDIEAPEYRTKLENHLKSADFFDVAKYPTAKFVITSCTPITEQKEGGYTHNVKGNLTIK